MAGGSNAEEFDDDLDRFKFEVARDANAMLDQRVAAGEDMRFVNVTGGMWENWGASDFIGDRARMELDLVSDYLQTFLGQWEQNRVGVVYESDDAASTTEEDSELLNGIYRANYRQFSGKIATDNAVSEAATCGYGAFKLATDFDDEDDPENENQHVKWVPIYDAHNTVFWDDSSKRTDKQDARHCTVLEQFTRDSFLTEFPGKDPVSAYTPETATFPRSTGGRSSAPALIYVATRYEVVKVKETMFVYNNLQSRKIEAYTEEQHEEVKAELKKDENIVFVRKRDIKRRRIEKTVFSGAEILEPTRRIVGKWIPIIPMFGYHQWVGGAEWYRGLVRKLKDAARLFNMQMSQLAENAASNGQEVPIFTPAQMENPDIKKLWADKNNQPYLLVDLPADEEGKVISPNPVLGYSKPAQLDQSTTTLLQIVPQFVQQMTGGNFQEAFEQDMSGKAIKALLKRIDMKTQKINGNISDAIAWSGTVYQGMAAEIYTDQRMVKTISRDGTDGETQLHKTVMGAGGTLVVINDLRGRRFQAYADVGPAYDTLREQTVEDLKGMLELFLSSDDPTVRQYVPVAMSIMMENITGVGMDPLKEFNRRIMLERGLVNPDTPEEEKLVADLQQQKQQEQQNDPQANLVAAAAKQQQAEATNLEAGSEQKLADAGKKRAETRKIESEIGTTAAKNRADSTAKIIDIRSRVLGQAGQGAQR